MNDVLPVLSEENAKKFVNENLGLPLETPVGTSLFNVIFDKVDSTVGKAVTFRTGKQKTINAFLKLNLKARAATFMEHREKNEDAEAPTLYGQSVTDLRIELHQN